MKKTAIALGIFCLAALFVAAHPHIAKTVTAKIDGNDVKLSYFTAPANMDHVQSAASGTYSHTGAVLTLPADMGSLKAGEYMVGAIKNDDGTWTMALHPGKLSFRDSADVSKVVKLNSYFSKDHGQADHIHYDISPGSGSLEGKTVVSWHFGDHFLSGEIK